MKDTVIITPISVIAKNSNTDIQIKAKNDPQLYDYIVKLAQNTPAEELFKVIVDTVDDEIISSTINMSYTLPEGFTFINGNLYYKDLCMSEGNFVRRFALTKCENIPRIVKFIDKLSQVNARDIFEMICGFLETQSDIMIDDGGDLIMWKRIDRNYRAYHSNLDGTYNLHKLNIPITMNRDGVERDSTKTCSSGLHVCAKSYLDSYGHQDGIICKCKVDVRDIISIPYDYNNAKIRCCKYIPIEFIVPDELKYNKNVSNTLSSIEEKYNGISASEYIMDKSQSINYTANQFAEIITKYLTKVGKSKTIRGLQQGCIKLKYISVKDIYAFLVKYGDKLSIKLVINKKKPAISNIKVILQNKNINK